jgi:hypothetical protein
MAHAPRSLAAKLVALASLGQHGHRCTPRNFFMGDPDRVQACGPHRGAVDPNALYCEYYWSNAKFDMTYEEYRRVARLSNRYRRFVHHVTEVKPGWREVERVHYADNSIEAVQLATDGRSRTVLVVGPGGDPC